MFDSDAFSSWIYIVVGAGVFATLFGVMTAMGEALFDGYFGPTRASLALAAGAFLGYVAVAMLVRYEDGRR